MKNHAQKRKDLPNITTYAFGESIRKLKWVFQNPNFDIVNELTLRLKINQLLATIMVNRGVTDIKSAISFLEPKLRDMPNPFSIQDMDKAVDRFIQAVCNKEKITIFGDYDVDGTSSVALIIRFCNMLNIEAAFYIPEREKEGYGPNKNAISKIKNDGTSLLITVDCGATAFDALAHANAINLDTIVIDHHLSEDNLPKNVIMINPSSINDKSEYGKVAAVAVCFTFAIAVRNKLRSIGWFEKNNIEEPDLMPLSIFAALGTICDVMPLNNPYSKAIVICGLHFISSGFCVGITKLLQRNNITTIKTHHLGFLIGPRINAGGRVDQSFLAVELLITEDPIRAIEIVEMLEKLNEQRKVVESLVMQEAILQIEREKLYKNSVIVVIGKGWNIGILGIIASRIKERYKTAAIVMSLLNSGNIKGSGRSIPGLNLGQIFTKGMKQKILESGGGHAMAGGFSLKQENLERWSQYLNTEISEIMDRNTDLLDKVREFHVDAILRVEAVNIATLKEIDRAGPFGQDNSQPKFVIKEAKIVRTITSPGGNIGAFIADASKEFKRNYGAVRCVVYHGNNHDELGNFLKQNEGAVVDILGTIQASTKFNDKVDFIVEDIGIIA